MKILLVTLSMCVLALPLIVNKNERSALISVSSSPAILHPNDVAKIREGCTDKDDKIVGSICPFYDEDPGSKWVELNGAKITEHSHPKLYRLWTQISPSMCEDNSCQLLDTRSPRDRKISNIIVNKKDIKIPRITFYVKAE